MYVSLFVRMNAEISGPDERWDLETWASYAVWYVDSWASCAASVECHAHTNAHRHAHSNAHGHAHLTPQTPNTIQMNDRKRPQFAC